MDDSLLISSIATAIAGGAAVLIASTGELLVEKLGVYNIGLEGVMLIGALLGFLGADQSGSWLVGLLAGGAAGALFALIFGVATVVFRADMILVGVALSLIALGVTTQAGEPHVREAAASKIPTVEVPLLSDLPGLGRAVFEQSVMVYVALLLPLVAWLWLNRTRHGLDMRSIGENPLAADAAGLSVVGWRLAFVAIGGAFAGVGGAVLSLGTIGQWVGNITAGQGWIAFAIVFFAGWRPIGVLVGALLFGALGTLGDVGQAQGWSMPTEVFTALPYLGTVAMMFARAALIRRQSWPAALGTPFYRS
jgi:simple sugar transport system permease protein